ncbi:MAG TPA: hypothetical protein VFE47_14030 [Tepidisphaeraceae bacterium]|jgi:hypothetical protein|nr:hypothetical protein [Tepidisphaeraceae bacterium]
MSIILFFHINPEVARAETRDVSIYPVDGITPTATIPAGRYAFLEHYCIDPNCDCRRVLLAVLRQADRKVVAMISHGFDKPKPGSLPGEQTFLDPLNDQSECAPEFLKLFLDRVLDPLYASRLKRHYELAKAAGKDPNHPVHRVLRDSRREHRPKPKRSDARKRERRNRRRRR